MESIIKIGRWTIGDSVIETKKENNTTVEFFPSEIWSYDDKSEYNVYSLPVHLCSKSWISNIDLLDFNSAFLVCLEKFESAKPENFPIISWSETLRRQYKRFQHSLDINSFEGRKQLQYEAEYRATLSFEDKLKLLIVDPKAEYSPTVEVFGDKLSRNP